MASREMLPSFMSGTSCPSNSDNFAGAGTAAALPLFKRAFLGLHPQFVRERARVGVGTAAADRTAFVGGVVFLAGTADRKTRLDLGVVAGRAAGKGVFRQRRRVVFRLFQQRRVFGLFAGLAGADHINFGSVVCADLQTALFAPVKVVPQVFKFAAHYSSISILFPQLS